MAPPHLKEERMMTFGNQPIYHVAYTDENVKNFLSIYDLLELKKQNKLDNETYVWKTGMPKWIKAGKVSELKPLFAKPPTKFPEEILVENSLPDCKDGETVSQAVAREKMEREAKNA